MRGQKLKDIKSFNRKQVLNKVRSVESTTVAEISKATGMSRTIISNSLQHFSDVGLVEKTGKGESTNEGGKKPLLYSLVSDYRLFAISHENIDHVYSVIADLNGTILAERKGSIDSTITAECFIDIIISQYTDMLGELGYEFANLHSIVIATNCISNINEGLTVLPQHFIHWTDHINFKEQICSKPEISENTAFYTDNVIRFQTLAEEHSGKAIGYKNAVVLEVRLGLVAGNVINGEIYRGDNFLAGEIGHMTVDLNDDYLCHCGNYGCLENKISKRRLLHRGREVVDNYPNSKIADKVRGDTLDAEELFIAADASDELACYLIDEAAKWFALGISNIILNINPEIIIIQGDYEFGSGYFNTKLQECLNKGIIAKMGLTPKIEYSDLGHQRCVIGAAYFLREIFFNEKH